MEKITRENIDKYTYVIEGKIPDKPIDDHFGEGFGFLIQKNLQYSKIVCIFAVQNNKKGGLEHD